jgi:hypothetical protein
VPKLSKKEALPPPQPAAAEISGINARTPVMPSPAKPRMA